MNIQQPQTTEKVWIRVKNDIGFAKYLLETLAPDLRKAGQEFTAGDVENAGHRLLAAAEALEVTS